MAKPGEQIPVVVVKQAALDATGAARFRFDGPGQAFDVLVVATISLDCPTGNLPTARLYAGEAGIGRLVATTLNGRSGQFVGDVAGGFDVIDAGRVWTVDVTGGTAGAIMTVTLTGTERRRGS